MRHGRGGAQTIGRIVLVLICGALVPAACLDMSRRGPEGTGAGPHFAIYRVADGVDITSPGRIDIEIEKLRLAEPPVLSDPDIVSYDWAAHRLTLTPEAMKRLPERPGVWGEPFVVVADGKRRYVGAFWSHLSSYLPRIPIAYTGRLLRTEQPDQFRIEPPPIAGTPDPRGDPRIRAALEAAGKLKAPSPGARG